MKVLAIAITRSHLVLLCDALLSVAVRTPGMLDGMQIKVPAKQVRNPEYITGVHIAKHFVDKLRKGLLRMQLKESMHNMLAKASDIDENNKNEMKRQTFVPAKQSEVPLELRSTKASRLDRPACSLTHFSPRQLFHGRRAVFLQLTCNALTAFPARNAPGDKVQSREGGVRPFFIIAPCAHMQHIYTYADMNHTRQVHRLNIVRDWL